MDETTTNTRRLAGQIVFVLLLLALAYAILSAVGGWGGSSDSRRLRFQVDASGGAALITLDAGQTQITNAKQVSTPWSQTVQVKSGTQVYLTAVNPNAVGILTCVIQLDGVEWKAESTNAPSIGVACAGIVP